MIERSVKYKNIILSSGSVNIENIEKKININFDINEDIKEVKIKVYKVFDDIKNHNFNFKNFESYKDFIETNLKIMTIYLFLDTEKLEKVSSTLSELSSEEEVKKDLILMEKVINRIETDFGLVNMIASKSEKFYSQYMEDQGKKTFNKIEQALSLARKTLENINERVSTFILAFGFKKISDNKSSIEIDVLNDNNITDNLDNILDSKEKDSLSAHSSSRSVSPQILGNMDESYTSIDDPKLNAILNISSPRLDD